MHPASQRALVGQMRLLFSWKSIWKPCSLSAVTPNVHHACLYRVQQVLRRHLSSADSQLWWSQTKHIVTLPITRLLYCNCCHITYLQHLFHLWQSRSLKACLYEENLSQVKGSLSQQPNQLLLFKSEHLSEQKSWPRCSNSPRAAFSPFFHLDQVDLTGQAKGFIWSRLSSLITLLWW